MTLTFKRGHLLLLFDLWWVGFISLISSASTPTVLYNVVTFISLVCIPGILTIQIIRLPKLRIWTYIVLMVGFGLLDLMLIGLFLNTLLPVFGIMRPLDTISFMPGLTVCMSVLATIAWIRASDISISIPRPAPIDLRALAFALFPSIFVVLSILGAIRLNNGANGTVTFFMLIGIALYCIALLRYNKHLGENVIPTALYFISLSLLLMTSLRGWYITGHDIQHEFSVFQLAKSAGIWNINTYHDAYNACMSITILPTIFATMMRISDPYVYKVIFQMIFALVPSIIYMSVRRYASAFVALLSVLYFIAFPTFFTDMPFLNRQEIAFLFLALMAYSVFDENLPLSMRRVLFGVFGIGMILSHYSTTYTVIALLLFVVVARPFLPVLHRLASKILSRFRLTTDAPDVDMGKQQPRITISLVLFLACASFLWSSILTDTSSNSLYRVAIETIHVIQNNTKEEGRSSDVLYGLFSFRKLDGGALLQQYEKNVVASARAETPSAYYNAETYAQYPVHLTLPDMLPLSPLGSTLSSWGVNISAFNTMFRQWSAKILQLLIFIGACAILLRRYLEHMLDTEFALLGFGSLVFVFSIVVLPVLSVEYGLLRAFQQSLIFLGVFAAVGSLTVFAWVRESIRMRLAGGLAILFLLSMTGVITQSLGGYDPQLHLNNAGTYYDYFYTRGSETAGVSWLSAQLQANPDQEYQIENLSGRSIPVSGLSTRQASSLDDIYPGLIRKNSYVFLDATNVEKQESAISYQGTSLTYLYPVAFLDTNKNLVYSNGNVNVYR